MIATNRVGTSHQTHLRSHDHNNVNNEHNATKMSLVLLRNRLQVFSCVFDATSSMSLTLEDKGLIPQSEYEYRCSFNNTDTVVGRVHTM
eukprot:gnl/Chilomastix_caulleri/3734.p1 GENE.gnl/Chilomastix_caulleri/3734~~gnl/Chilomastix_caulleri/3734.p1  ORF type:complete len:89 (-),score=15.23 gnl/Chilomastix_caulleri/3734:158-424(-)